MGIRILHDEDEIGSFSFITKLGRGQSIQNFEDSKHSAAITVNLSTPTIQNAMNEPIQNL
jgi:hypothetical protein